MIRRLPAASLVLARFGWQCLTAGAWYFGRFGAVMFSAMIVVVTVGGVVDGYPVIGPVIAVFVLAVYAVVGALSLEYRERYEASVGRARQLAAVMVVDSVRPAHALAHEAGVNVGAAVALLWRMEARGWAVGSDGGYRLTARGARAFEKPRVSL
ncbi:hypothetical protein [Nocardia sp. NPDC003963]